MASSSCAGQNAVSKIEKLIHFRLTFSGRSVNSRFFSITSVRYEEESFDLNHKRLHAFSFLTVKNTRVTLIEIVNYACALCIYNLMFESPF